MTLSLSSIRRDLHRIPELGFDLPLTSQYLFDALTSMGYQPQSIAQTGWL
jgi:metal-dependent amidase/aminoacylase/carboxypeptidase family protein